MTCKNCGQKLPEDARYCDFCGAGQERAEAPEAVSAGAAAPAEAIPPEAALPEGAGARPAPPAGAVVWTGTGFAPEGAAAPAPPVSGAPIAMPGYRPDMPDGAEAPAPGVTWTTESGFAYSGGEAPARRPWYKRIHKGHVVVAAVLVVLLAGWLTLFLLRPRDDKTVALDAITKTRAQLDDESAQRQKLLSAGDVFADLRERPVKQRLELRVKSLRDGDGQAMEIPDGAGIRLELRQDIPNRRIALDSGFGVESADFFRLMLQCQGDEIAVNIPQADPNWYGFNTRTWAKDFENSIFADGETLPDEEGFSIFDALQGEPEPSAQFYNSKEIDLLWSRLKGTITASPAVSEQASVNGQTLGCDRITLRIPQGAIDDYMQGAWKSVKHSEGFQNALRDYAGFMTGQSGYGDQAQNALERQLDALAEELRHFFASDVTLDVFIRDGRAVKLNFSGQGQINGQTRGYRAALEYGRKTGALSDAIRFCFSTDGPDGGTLNFTMQGNAVPENAPYTCDLELTLENGSGNIGAWTSSIRYDPRGGDNNFQFEMQVSSPDQPGLFRLSAGGTVHADPQARSFTAQMDSIRLALQDDFDLTLRGSYSIEPLDTKKEPIDKVPMVSVFGLSEQDFLNLVYKLLNAFQGGAA